MERRDDVGVLVIAANGPVFCAGGDLADMPTDARSAQAFMVDVINLLTRPERLRKPVIAAVDGPALGGGLELVLGCDLVVASERAVFGVPEAAVGLAPGFAIVRLRERVGASVAKEMAMAGRRLSAAEARDLGLVNRVVPSADLLADAKQLAGQIQRSAPLSVQLIKSAMNRPLGGEDTTYAIDAMTHLFLTKDTAEGLAAFKEKRAPRFIGE